MSHETLLLKDSYMDSIRLLEATRAMLGADGVEYAWALMGTPANLDVLITEGFDQLITEASEASTPVGANDLVLAVRATDNASAGAALELGRSLLCSAKERGTDGHSSAELHDLGAAMDVQPETNVAIVSVPGAYATLETHRALSADLDVLLFSDNVPLEDEIALKVRASGLGRLVMGPGAGTAMLAGIGLGFANRVRPGTVGVVAAAGTGAQEVMSLLDRWGVGVSHVIGVGGRDLSDEVGGLMTRSGIEALEDHEGTEVILLVSKPPSPDVVELLLGVPRTKPIIAALIGLREPLHGLAAGVAVCTTLEQGATLAARAVGAAVPEAMDAATVDAVADAIIALDPQRRCLVGLFSGGTLCYEAMTIAGEHLGPIHSNTPLAEGLTLPAPPGAHVCLDLGEEEYTVGRPHPMIDPTARLDWMLQQVDDRSVAVVLLDVVLGDGAHPDPAGLLAPAAAKIVSGGAVVVAYVLGTDTDPQGYAQQRRTMVDAGCIVTETAARAALAAAAVVNRDPALLYADL